MFEEQNVKFYMNDGVTEIRGDNGKVSLSLFYSFTLSVPVYVKCLDCFFVFKCPPKCMQIQFCNFFGEKKDYNGLRQEVCCIYP